MGALEDARKQIEEAMKMAQQAGGGAYAAQAMAVGAAEVAGNDAAIGEVPPGDPRLEPIDGVSEAQVEVTVEGAETYTAVIKDAISPILIPQVQPGATVPVRVDPADRDSVIFDWARTATM